MTLKKTRRSRIGKIVMSSKSEKSGKNATTLKHRLEGSRIASDSWRQLFFHVLQVHHEELTKLLSPGHNERHDCTPWRFVQESSSPLLAEDSAHQVLLVGIQSNSMGLQS